MNILSHIACAAACVVVGFAGLGGAWGLALAGVGFLWLLGHMALALYRLVA